MKAKSLIGLAAFIGGIYFLIKRASGAPPPPPECQTLEYTMAYYYLKYIGASKTFKFALGECYDFIYTIDVWSDYYGSYEPPSDPENDILEQGSACRVMVLSPCELCGFQASVPRNGQIELEAGLNNIIYPWSRKKAGDALESIKSYIIGVPYYYNEEEELWYQIYDTTILKTGMLLSIQVIQDCILEI